jgi:hypothetical protein
VIEFRNVEKDKRTNASWSIFTPSIGLVDPHESRWESSLTFMEVHESLLFGLEEGVEGALDLRWIELLIVTTVQHHHSLVFHDDCPWRYVFGSEDPFSFPGTRSNGTERHGEQRWAGRRLGYGEGRIWQDIL